MANAQAQGKDGKIVQIIGSVIDVEFPRESIPSVYEALKLVDGGLTLEVQQQLGDGIVRTIAMGSSEGLKRGLEARNTGEGIKVPVGVKTLGRIMDVLGNPIDECGPIGEPSTSMMRPSVASPTGTLMPSPVFSATRPRFRPSVEPSAIVRTMPSPSCCCTSSVISVPLTLSASYTFGTDSRGNSTSTTAPMI